MNGLIHLLAIKLTVGGYNVGFITGRMWLQFNPYNISIKEVIIGIGGITCDKNAKWRAALKH